MLNSTLHVKMVHEVNPAYVTGSYTDSRRQTLNNFHIGLIYSAFSSLNESLMAWTSLFKPHDNFKFNSGWHLLSLKVLKLILRKVFVWNSAEVSKPELSLLIFKLFWAHLCIIPYLPCQQLRQARKFLSMWSATINIVNSH